MTCFDENERNQPVSVACDDGFLTVALTAGRRIVTSLWCYPRLLHASPEQRANVEFSRFGRHWEEIDEDLTIDGMLRDKRLDSPWKKHNDVPL